MRRLLFVLGLVLVVAPGCKSDSGGNEDEAGASLDQALTAAAEAAVSYAEGHEGQFPTTSAPVYCRGGGSMSEGAFAEIGFAPEDDSAEFCFNVADNGDRVAISAASNPMAESKRCLTVDMTGEEAVISEISDSEACMP